MNQGMFNANELSVCDFQYTIRWHKPSDFKISELVFLKSNPEIVMTVYSINSNDVVVSWKNSFKDIEYGNFPPECILQYKYSSLVTFLKKFNLHLN